MKTLIAMLQNIVNSSTEEDMNKTIARYLMENITNTELMKQLTVEKLAEYCYTSSASVSRFSRHLGFKNFNEMKKVYLNHNDSAKIIINTTKQQLDFSQGEAHEILDNYIQFINYALQDLADTIDFEQIDQLCHKIHQTKHVYFFGTHLPGLFMQYMQYQFSIMGKFIEYYRKRQDQEEMLSSIPTDSLVIIFSGNGNFMDTIRGTVASLSNNDAYNVLVTQEKDMKIARLFDEVFSLGEDKSEKGSRYKFQLFTELIINRYAYLYDK